MNDKSFCRVALVIIALTVDVFVLRSVHRVYSMCSVENNLFYHDKNFNYRN